MIEGGCFCGTIRYAIDDGEYLVANCHCSMCRRTSAAAFVTWMVVPLRRFRYTQGEPTELASSDNGRRYFCNRCGTPVACIITTRPNEVDVTTGSLDDPGNFRPTMDVHQDTMLPWLPAASADPGASWAH